MFSRLLNVVGVCGIRIWAHIPLSQGQLENEALEEFGMVAIAKQNIVPLQYTAWQWNQASCFMIDEHDGALLVSVSDGISSDMMGRVVALITFRRAPEARPLL